MKKIFLLSFLLVSVISLCLAAVALDGKWAGKYEAKYDVTLDLKTKGKTLSGNLTIADNGPVSENPDDVSFSPFIAAQMGNNVIIGGQVTKADEFTFKTKFNDKEIVYTGKVEGDKIILTAVFSGTDVKTTLRKN